MAVAVHEDIMFDSEPIGLADELAPLDAPLTAVIVSDEEPEVGDEIYFGLPTAIGEIAEVKAKVLEVDAADEDAVRITIEALAADAAFLKAACDALAGASTGGDAAGEPVWGLGLKQMNGAYAVLVNAPGGVLTADQFAAIAAISKEGAGILKLTHAQRVVLLMGADQLEGAKETLEAGGLRVGVLHHGIRNIRACCGALCRFAQGTDAITLAQKLDEHLFGRGTTFDVKLAVSDCMRNCSESYCADIGLLGGADGYTIVVGGRGSQVPFRALVLKKDVPQDDVIQAVTAVIDWYEQNAEPKERFWKTLQRLGADSAASVDLSSLETALAPLDDGVDDLGRTRDHLARLAGLKVLQDALA